MTGPWLCHWRTGTATSEPGKCMSVLQHEEKSDTLRLFTWQQILSRDELRRYFGKDDTYHHTNVFPYKLSMLQVNSTGILNKALHHHRGRASSNEKVKTQPQSILLALPIHQSPLARCRIGMNLKLSSGPSSVHPAYGGLPNLKIKLPFTRWKHAVLTKQCSSKELTKVVRDL